MVAQAYSSCHSEMHEWRWPVTFLARPFVYRKCAMTVGNFTVSNVAAGVRALSCRFFSQSVYQAVLNCALGRLQALRL